MAIVLAVGVVSTLVVVAALFAMRKYATPSTKPGSSGSHAGFKPLPVTEGGSSGKGSAKPVESINEMLAGSETLEFEEDVEKAGSGWGWKPDNGHVTSPFSIHQSSRLNPKRGE